MTALTVIAEAAARQLVEAGHFPDTASAAEAALVGLASQSDPDTRVRFDALVAADRLIAEATASGWTEDFDFEAFLREEGLDADQGSH